MIKSSKKILLMNIIIVILMNTNSFAFDPNEFSEIEEGIITTNNVEFNPNEFNETEEISNIISQENNINEDDSSADPNSSNTDDYPFTSTDPSLLPEEDELDWILLAIFGFLFLGVGVGGFYAYKKVYLDEQLKKIGIENKNIHSKTLNIQSSNHSQISRKDLDKNKFQPLKSHIDTNQSKYDSHINKLNSFIDLTLNKDSKMFDKFENGEKNKDSEIFDQFQKNGVNKSSNQDSSKESSLKETLIRNKIHNN